MSNYHTPGQESGASSNGNSFTSRREIRASNTTGALPPLGALGIERSQSGTFDFEQMVHSLHELFEQDRQMASQSDTTRCGICYLHYHVNELHYRAEGFYVCPGCAQNLGNQPLTILRRQQKL